jgi:signal transduction histidine kinase
LLAVAELAVWPGAPLVTGAVAAGWQVAAVTVATVAVALVLGFRTVAPVWSLAGTCCTLAVWRLLAPPASIGFVTVSDLVALFSVAAHCSARTTVVATGAAGAAAILVGLPAGDLDQGSSLVAGTGAAVLVAADYALVAALGRVWRRWRLARRAATERLAAAGAARPRAALVERHRLARDLHDIVAHRLTAVVVSANAGLRLGDRRPELAAQALRLAAESGRETLGVVHRMVAVAGLDEPNPDHGLRDRLDELAAGLVLLGQPVTVHVDDEQTAGPGGGEPTAGPGGGEPAAVVLAGHAIAREALTNALRYAPGAPVTVRLLHRPGVLELTVANAGSARPPARDLSGGGRGLPGMRERAAQVGGALTAGPTAGGGWSVRASPTRSGLTRRQRNRPGGSGTGPAAPGPLALGRPTATVGPDATCAPANDEPGGTAGRTRAG